VWRGRLSANVSDWNKNHGLHNEVYEVEWVSPDTLDDRTRGKRENVFLTYLI
jgi:hypothetical protein